MNNESRIKDVMQLTLWKFPHEQIFSEYGYIFYQDWCEREIKKLDGSRWLVYYGKSKLPEDYFFTKAEAEQYVKAMQRDRQMTTISYYKGAREMKKPKYRISNVVFLHTIEENEHSRRRSSPRIAIIRRIVK